MTSSSDLHHLSSSHHEEVSSIWCWLTTKWSGCMSCWYAERHRHHLLQIYQSSLGDKSWEGMYTTHIIMTTHPTICYDSMIYLIIEMMYELRLIVAYHSSSTDWRALINWCVHVLRVQPTYIYDNIRRWVHVSMVNDISTTLMYLYPNTFHHHWLEHATLSHQLIIWYLWRWAQWYVLKSSIILIMKKCPASDVDSQPNGLDMSYADADDKWWWQLLQTSHHHFSLPYITYLADSSWGWSWQLIWIDCHMDVEDSHVSDSTHASWTHQPSHWLSKLTRLMTLLMTRQVHPIMISFEDIWWGMLTSSPSHLSDKSTTSSLNLSDSVLNFIYCSC